MLLLPQRAFVERKNKSIGPGLGRMKKTTEVDIESLSRRDLFISTAIVGMMFFLFGFMSWVNAILIPYFKIACELNNVQSYLVTFAFYITYLFFSVPSSFLLKSIGFRKGIMIGFWIVAFGAFLFVPAALSRAYPVFLCGLFSIGTGLAILQSAANPYITILGSKERAVQRISLMGICNKTAGIVAPLVFAFIVLKGSDTALFQQLPFMDPVRKAHALDELIRRVIPPYAGMACILFILGLLIRYSPLPELNTERESEEIKTTNSGKNSIFAFPHLILGALAIFLHVGTQVISIDTIIGYAGSMHISLLEAKVFPSYTIFATICGYWIGIVLIPVVISQENALRICTVLGLVFSLMILFAHGYVHLLGHYADISIWFVVLLGLANSLVWAGIWPLALDQLGRFTKLGGSILIMGLSGNAIMSLLYGKIADLTTLRAAYWILVPCYLYLIFYAFQGHRIRTWSFIQKHPELERADTY